METKNILSAKVTIAAPPQQVWRVMSDVENWHTWTESIRKVKLLDQGPLGLGKKARVYQPNLAPAVWRVTDWKEGRGFTWVSSNPGVHVTADHVIKPVDEGSEVTLSIKYDGIFGGVVRFLTARITKRYIDLEAAGLKKHSERT